MWNMLSPQQQQFFTQLMGGTQQQGVGNPLMGAQSTPWSALMAAYGRGQPMWAGAGNWLNGAQPPPIGANPAADAAANPQQFAQAQWMRQMQPWMQNQLPPGYGQDGGGPSYSPYAMPGTPQYNPNAT